MTNVKSQDKQTTLGGTEDRTLVITRILNAPRELVWKAWTEPKHLIKWWGPHGFTNTFEQIDIRPGGTWKFIMHGPDGTDYQNQIVFRQIMKPELITYTHGTGEETGAGDFEVEISFEKLNEKTRITMKMVMASAEELKAIREFGAEQGGNETLDRLEELLLQLS